MDFLFEFIDKETVDKCIFQLEKNDLPRSRVLIVRISRYQRWLISLGKKVLQLANLDEKHFDYFPIDQNWHVVR